MSLLQINGLTKQFGGLTAVDDLTFDVNEGEILGLIGPNGAGKTTVFNLLTGLLMPTKGKAIFNGEDITGLRPSKVAEKGMVRTWQVSGLFANMTVWQSVIIGCHIHCRIGFWQAIFGGASKRKKEEAVQERAARILELMGLASYKDMLTKHLPIGILRRLGVSIALGAEPKLLLLDEPVSGMNPEETLQAMELVKDINKSGVTVLLVEHNMRAVMSTCHRIVVIQYGKKIAEGTPQEIVRNEQVIQAYLGGAAKRA